MKARQRLLSTAAGVLLCSTAVVHGAQTADVVYVTDELRLGLYQGEETTGRAIKTLTSGARLQILERALMSVRVRTEEGDEGWVKTAYLVETEPARRRVVTMEQQQIESTKALASTEAARAELSERAASLENSLQQARQDITHLPQIQAENEQLKADLNAAGMSVPVVWLILATLLALSVGWFVGYWWLDRRVRKKFGGVRVY